MKNAKPDAAPLVGDAKWRATKEAIAKRNDAARERMAGERFKHETRIADARRAAERRVDDQTARRLNASNED